MDVRFLKEISEAYVIDSGLDQSPDQIYEDLYEAVKFLQTYHVNLYEELYEVSKSRQQKIFKNYLDNTYQQEPLTEDAGVVTIPASFIIAGIIGLLFGKPAVNVAANVLSTLGEGFETLGKWLARHGKYSQIRYSIIQENTRKCYAQCGIQKPSDINVLSYMTIKSSSVLGTKESVKQGECLRECYIDELVSLIGLHMENYFACLKRTGSFDVIQKTDSDDIMKMVSSTNIAAACESYYTAARDNLDNFYRVLELVYDKKDEDDKRLAQINKLRSKIYEARQTVQRTDQRELQRYGSGNFPAPAARPVQHQQPLERPRFSQQNNNPNFRRN